MAGRAARYQAAIGVQQHTARSAGPPNVGPHAMGDEPRTDPSTEIRQTARPPSPGGGAGATDAAGECIARLEQQIGAVRAWQHERDELAGQLDRQAAGLRAVQNETDRRAAALDEREAALDRRDQQMQATAARLAEQGGQLADRRRELDAARAGLERDRAARQERARTGSATHETMATTDGEPLIDVRRLAERERTLARRRERLRRYRRQLRQLRSAARDHDAPAQRQLLADAQRFLADTERQMIKRWSVDRGFRRALLFATGLVMLAMGSYAAACLFAPPIWQATATLALPETSGIADREALLPDPVLERVIDELGRRGLRPFPAPEALHAHLQPTLQMTWSEDRTVALAYRHADPQLALFMLEAISAATQQGTDRSPSMVAVAALSPTPVTDRRLPVAVRVLALAIGVTALIGLILARRLERRSGMLDMAPYPALLAAVRQEDR